MQELGTKAKQQLSALQAARAAREYKIVEFGGYKEELKRRAEELSSRVVSVEEKDAELKAKILPPFNASATNPWDVYKAALEKIAPSNAMAAEEALLTQDLQDLVKASMSDQLKAAIMREQEREIRLSQPREVQEITEKHAIRSRFLAAVVKQRAKAQMVVKDEMQLCRRYAVLEKLVTLCARGGHFKGGKCRPDGVSLLLDFKPEGALTAHWHEEYYEEMLNKNKVRAFSGRKTLCALMVWALHLTPELVLELPTAVEREMGLDHGGLKKSLEYVGCTVTEQKQGSGLEAAGAAGQVVLVAKLEGPPKINMDFYDHEQKMAKPKKKKG